MNATDLIVHCVRSSTPTPEAVAMAAEQLDRFRRARDTGQPPASLAAIAATEKDPLWTAWLSAATVAGVDPSLPWIAVCAAAAALAEGERAATAVAIGTEVADRVAAVLGPTHTAAGWDVRATAGVVGAGAAAGWLCGLDDDALRAAIGLCATQAAGTTAAAGTDAEALQLGKAAANAVEAALLGQCGFTSAAEPLEGRRGMFALMSTGSDLGRDWG